MRFEPRRELRRFSASIASLLLHRSPPWLSLRWSECEKECVNEFWSLNWISIVAFWFWIWAGVGVLVDLGLSHYRPLRLTYRVMLGAPALLLVHPAIVFNSLNAPGVFFLLKLVAVLFFLLCLHCFFLHFLPLLLICVGFSLLRELSLGSRWKCYGSVVIVAVVVSSSSTFKVRHFAAFCWVCVSWSVCVSYKYWSSWFVRSIQIKLIREIYTNQVDP